MTNHTNITIPQAFTGETDTSTETRQKYSTDASIFQITPQMVAYPCSVEDLSILVNYAREHSNEVSLTARAAGTDMSGGPLSDSIVIDFLRHFDEIISVNKDQACVQPGIFYRDLETQTLEYDALLPSYTASKDLNTVGGMVANNSAGEKSLTYGKTERYVQELKMILQDGNEYIFSKINRQQLEAKKSQNDFEGEIYRSVEQLIVDNHGLIESQKPQVSKNSAGYGIWNVWDKQSDTFDLTQLFVGSQGTLGLISEITFDLVPVQPESRMLIIFLDADNMGQLGEIINQVLVHNPESFESYDDKTFNVMLRVFPKLFMRLGGNPFRILYNFWPEIKMVVRGGIPKLVLMAEFAGSNADEVITQVENAQQDITEHFSVATHVTSSESEADKYWTIRRESFSLLREEVQGKHTAPFIDDLVVAPEYLPTFLPRLYEILDEYDLVYTVAGHVGSGNFHIIPLMDLSRADFVDIINVLSQRVYQLVGEYHGSITGEHNDGLIRTPYLHYMFSPQMLEVFAQIKQIFDPQNIFNPGKKVNPRPELLRTAIKDTVD